MRAQVSAGGFVARLFLATLVVLASGVYLVYLFAFSSMTGVTPSGSTQWWAAALDKLFFSFDPGIASWPFFGFMARRLSIIFVDRGNVRAIPGVNQSIDESLAQGHVLVVFPEGRTGSGERVLPFRSSLLEPAARGGHAVAWATIEYRTVPPDPPASEVVCWKDGAPIREHAMRILRLDRIEATVTFGDGTLRGSDRKALAAELQRRVEAQFTPIP